MSDEVASLGLAVLLGLGAAALSLFVLVDMWAWFIIPLGLPSVSLWHMFGLRMVARLVIVGMPNADVDNQTARQLVTRQVAVLFAWGIAWAMAAAVHSWGVCP